MKKIVFYTIIAMIDIGNLQAANSFLIPQSQMAYAGDSTQQLAFPGADGYAKYVTGGRGGEVYEVTNLSDDGLPGSLRYAINQSGPRTIVFRVSGTIELNSGLRITNGDLTIAGQTAPGDGICIRNHNVRIDASNVIIRYLRFRLGDWWDSDGDGTDALSGMSPKNSAGDGTLPLKNIMIDHCSVSYGTDETLSVYDIENLTVQWCIISESLNKEGHGYGGIIGGWGASFHHNLFAHHKSRAPRFCGARYQFNLEREMVDMRYNVIYNAGKTYGGEGGNHNVVNNYYKRASSSFCNPSQPNPSETDREFEGLVYDSIKSYWYIEGNYIYGNPTVTADNWDGGVKLNYPPLNIRLYSPLDSAYLGEYETAEEAFVKVCNGAGALLPKRDTVDRRVVADVINGTGSVPLTLADIPGEAFPVLNSLPPPEDQDHDGMPDDWETEHGLSNNDPSDRNIVASNGYTMLENYLNGIDTSSVVSNVPHPINRSKSSTKLVQIFPNPAGALTQVEFYLQEGSVVDISIIDINGMVIRQLTNGFYGPGTHTLTWNVSDEAGQSVKPGIYVCTLKTRTGFRAQKFTVINN